MAKLLIVVDMQNDFVTGSLANTAAQKIIPNIIKKIEEYKNETVLFTLDTHQNTYLQTSEGKKLPVEHCIKGTSGHDIVDQLAPYAVNKLEKPTFGYKDWGTFLAKFAPAAQFDVVELVGTCTDICVVSNALILKAVLPDAKIIVDANCCAGLTPEKHLASLDVMESCQIEVIR